MQCTGRQRACRSHRITDMQVEVSRIRHSTEDREPTSRRRATTARQKGGWFLPAHHRLPFLVLRGGRGVNTLIFFLQRLVFLCGATTRRTEPTSRRRATTAREKAGNTTALRARRLARVRVKARFWIRVRVSHALALVAHSVARFRIRVRVSHALALVAIQCASSLVPRVEAKIHRLRL